jgi:hypothetical protein
MERLNIGDSYIVNAISVSYVVDAISVQTNKHTQGGTTTLKNELGVHLI